MAETNPYSSVDLRLVGAGDAVLKTALGLYSQHIQGLFMDLQTQLDTANDRIRELERMQGVKNGPAVAAYHTTPWIDPANPIVGIESELDGLRKH